MVCAIDVTSNKVESAEQVAADIVVVTGVTLGFTNR